MSEAIKPLDPQALIDLFPETPSAYALSRELELLEGDALYAPADVSETPVGPMPRRVQTLTNSPGCLPSTTSPISTTSTSESSGSDSGETPVREARSVRPDAWALPAPANWGRTRRAGPARAGAARATNSGVRRVEPGAARSRRGARSTARPSSDWSLPF